ncbi:hypothetical protein LSCM1_04043 [Leishmania martiniquensis]|uniref:Uncharacterized protein n=1 Tax=Leishmania martiniquensis TaxID=1580590 RepID=A0A836GJP7_9TRYP|nr:hypothetical protein LSCM1_04043 [Leishmania martiniquensis]
MRTVGPSLSVRRLSEWAVAPSRLKADAVGCLRRCSTVGGGTAPSASARLTNAPLLPSPTSFATVSAARNTPSDVTALFDFYFNEVPTTLDIAPIKRPHVVGSLCCAVEEYPISVVLVEGCCGTSAEAVAESVRRSAIHSAQGMHEVTQKPLKTLIVHHLCTARPQVVELLYALDLSLRVRLLRQDTLSSALKEESKSPHHDRGGVSDVSSIAPEKSGQSWRCSAALYDVWDTQPRFVPVEGAASRGMEAERDEVGELLDVIGRTLDRVEVQLRRLRARHARDTVEEACRFVQCAGGDFCERQLTQRCLGVQTERHGGASHNADWRCPWWGESRARLRWSLQCDADVDAPRSKAVAFHLCLTCTLHAICTVEMSGEVGVAAVLQSSRTYRGLAQVVDNKAADGVLRRYTNPGSCSAHPRELYTLSALSRMSANGRLSTSNEWAGGPVDLANHLLTAAAMLSPTIAYDWIGAARGAGEAASEEVLSGALATESNAPHVGLPACVRWSSFAGRATLNDFEVQFRGAGVAAGRGGAGGGYSLPPLWPQLRLLRSGTAEGRCAAFRELLRHEHGVRGLPRVSLKVRAIPALSLEYDAELTVSDGDTHSKPLPYATTRDPTSIQVMCGDCYPDVAAAAQVHTPWAAPLCTAAPPVSAAAAKRDRSDRVNTSPVHADTGSCVDGATPATLAQPSRISVEVLSISDSMSAMGMIFATWVADTAKLVVRRRASSSPVVFEDANTVGGYRRMLRYAAKRPVYKKVSLSTRSTLKETLQLLLLSMGSSASDPVGRLSRCTLEGDHSTRARGKGVRIVGHAGAGRSEGPMLVFPFNAGEVSVQANGRTAKETQRALFWAIKEHCRDAAQLSRLLSSARPAGSTFFHAWPPTAWWLSSRESRLEVSLTPVAHCSGAASLGGSGEKPSSASAERDAIEYDLRLSVNAPPSTSSGKGYDVADRCSAPLATVSVTRLPASAGWFSTAYGAMRRALILSHPDIFAEGDTDAASSTALGKEEDGGNAADQHWVLVRCATFTQAVEALLFTTVFSQKNAFSAQEFLTEIFGGRVSVRKQGAAAELWLSVAPNMPSVRLCTVDQSERKHGAHAAARWPMLLLYRVMDASCPEARATLDAMLYLQESVSALATANDNSSSPLQCILSCEWAHRSAADSESHRAEWTQVFVAELQRGAPASLDSASCPRWSKISMKQRRGNAAVHSRHRKSDAQLVASEVLHREEGPDSFGVLWRMLHCAALPSSEKAGLSSPASGQVLSRALIPSPSGFIKAAQRALARQRGMARVTHRYDNRLKSVVVEGWGPPRQHPHEAPCGTPVTLVAEPMPLQCVPLRLMQLYHRLVVQADTLPCVPEGVWKEIEAACEGAPTSSIVQSLCETLGCKPADLECVEARFSKVWAACLELPLHIFGFSVATAPSSSSSSSPAAPCCDAPRSLYLYCHRSSRRQAMRSLYVLLYQWTRYPQMEAPRQTIGFGIARSKSAAWHTWTASSLPSPSLAPPWPSTTTTTAYLKLQTGTGPGPATCASEAHAGQASPRALRSVLDAAHARMEASLSSLVDCTDGRVTLLLSQTFGLQLMYSVGAADALGKAPAEGSVQLLRERWVPHLWAPAQVLSAEVSVLERLLTHSITASEGGEVRGATDDMRGVLRELVCTGGPVQQMSLQSGPDRHAKEFCVAFFRRYFGWRVCERDDVKYISVVDAHSSVVIVQTAERAACIRGGQRCRSPRLASSQRSDAVLLGPLEHATATLQLTQIMSGAKTSVRLGRILVEVQGATIQAALDALWEQCTAQIETVFGVSCRMSPSEVDDQMIHYMQSRLG